MTREAGHPGAASARRYAEARGLAPDRFQLEAMQALHEGRSVVVAAPTGSGKTLVAEYGVELAVEGGARALYTTPLKALSNQKYHDLGSIHGTANVGLLTGDNSIRGDASVVVMTTEVLRNMLYTDPEAVADVGVVVLDEVHYLQDPYRGGVWEEVIIHLPSEVRIVCLSATVSNAEQFGSWVETLRGPTEVVVETHRPVPLEHHVGVKRGEGVTLLPLVAPTGSGPDRRVSALERRRGRGAPRTPRRQEVVTLLESRELLPAIYFIFSRVGCERAVEQMVERGVSLTTRAERREIRTAAAVHTEGIDPQDLSALGFEALLAGLLRGVASHHAGMVPPFREMVEDLFLSGLLKVVFATETLSLGINMPARSVVVEKLTKFGGERHEPLTPGQYTQLAGRAGRRGKDDVGHAVVLWSPFVPADQIYELAATRSYTLESSFTPNYNMVANLVARTDIESARAVVNSSFAQFRTDSAVVRLDRQARELRAAADQYRLRARETNGAARKRWDARAGDAERRLGRIERRAAARAGRLGDRFDAICRLLEDLGYLEEAEGGRPHLRPTRRGELLRRLYSETDLVAAEALSAGILDGLSPEELVAVVSTLTFEARREGPAEPMPPSRAIREAIRRMIDLSDDLARVESDMGLEPTRELDDGFAGTAYGWATGLGLEDLLDTAVGGGDFVRNVKQLMDTCRQMADATRDVGLHVEVGRNARRAADLLHRGVVALSSVEPGDEADPGLLDPGEGGTRARAAGES